MKTYRTLAATLAISALAVPAAQARPADIHAPLARAAAKVQQKDDLRSPDAHDAAISPRRQDLNHLAAGGTYTPGSRTPVSRPTPGRADSTTPPSVPAAPTWPANPQPTNPVPAAHASDTGDGLAWTTIAIGIASSLLILGGIVAIAVHSRRAARAHVAA